MSGPDQRGDSKRVGNQEVFQAPVAMEMFPQDTGLAMRRSPKRSSRAGVLLGGVFAIFVVGMGALVVLTKKGPTGPSSPVDSDDLGAGIANASGLRGHLVTRWEKGKTQYMLKFEPLDPRDNAGFAAATANPPGPISINIRILDSSGFALCGKEIDMHYDPARAGRANLSQPKNKGGATNGGAVRQADFDRASAQEKARESGKDVFQNIIGSDGAVEALWAQGELPCSPDQYKRFDYWDLSTNFPTIVEQQQMLGHHRPAGAAESDRAEAERAANARRKALPKPASAFYMEGDERATAFEPGRNLLTIGPGKTFTVVRTVDVATAESWADDSSLIHYTCDQHSTCALKRAGSASVILARMD